MDFVIVVSPDDLSAVPLGDAIGRFPIRVALSYSDTIIGSAAEGFCPVLEVADHRQNARSMRPLPPVFVSNDIFRIRGYRPNHPLSIGRIGPVMEICNELGWLDDENYAESGPASLPQLQSFHLPTYVEAVLRCSEAGEASQMDRERFGLGTFSNPIFPQLFQRAATAVGGSILAARLAREGRVAFHPAGGTHHGRADRASGFCYFNDPVFAIREFLESGTSRVAYVDVDAHHGDGVEAAFETDGRVLCMSVHEAGRWPGTGLAHGAFSRNYPVPAGFGDDGLRRLTQDAVLPELAAFHPDAIVVTCGADGLAGDPLSKLGYSNGGLWSFVESVIAGIPAAVVLGGGGYNPWTTVRCWAGLWGRLSGRRIPSHLPDRVQTILKDLSSDLLDEDDIKPEWFGSIADPS